LRDNVGRVCLNEDYIAGFNRRGYELAEVETRVYVAQDARGNIDIVIKYIPSTRYYTEYLLFHHQGKVYNHHHPPLPPKSSSQTRTTVLEQEATKPTDPEW